MTRCGRMRASARPAAATISTGDQPHNMKCATAAPTPNSAPTRLMPVIPTRRGPEQHDHRSTRAAGCTRADHQGRPPTSVTVIKDLAAARAGRSSLSAETGQAWYRSPCRCRFPTGCAFHRPTLRAPQDGSTQLTRPALSRWPKPARAARCESRCARLGSVSQKPTHQTQSM